MSNNRPVPPKSHSPQIRFPLYTSFLHNDSSARKGIVIFFGTATNSFELLIPLHSIEKNFLCMHELLCPQELLSM
jgi:hypothetical protein